MNQAKINRLVREQTPTATKVYDAVPLKENWTVGQIFAEMKRTGISMDMKNIQGCLSSLQKDGLLKEESGGGYIRVTASKPATVRAAPDAPKQAKEKIDPFALLIELADEVQNIRTEIDMSLVEIHDSISQAAISVAEQLEANDNDMDELRQLKKLLAKFGGGA